MRTPIGGGETASYPIQLNLMGPICAQLSGYALSMLEGRAGDAVHQRLEGAS